MAESKTDKKEEKLEDALLKVALGYQLAEVTEEYSEVNGELKLTKRKKTKKDIPPDLKAVQMLLSVEGEEYSALSDEELEKERSRLLTLLKKEQEKESTKEKSKANEGGRCATKGKTKAKTKSASKSKGRVKKEV